MQAAGAGIMRQPLLRRPSQPASERARLGFDSILVARAAIELNRGEVKRIEYNSIPIYNTGERRRETNKLLLLCRLHSGSRQQRRRLQRDKNESGIIGIVLVALSMGFAPAQLAAR